jgi:hypothetical protein
MSGAPKWKAKGIFVQTHQLRVPPVARPTNSHSHTPHQAFLHSADQLSSAETHFERNALGPSAWVLSESVFSRLAHIYQEAELNPFLIIQDRISPVFSAPASTSASTHLSPTWSSFHFPSSLWLPHLPRSPLLLRTAGRKQLSSAVCDLT